MANPLDPPVKDPSFSPLSVNAFVTSPKREKENLISIQVKLKLQKGFYAYGDKFQLKILDPPKTQVGELFIGPLVPFQDPSKGNQSVKKGIKDSGELKTQIRIPELKKNTELNSVLAQLTYTSCTKQFCLTPRSLSFKIPLPPTSPLKEVTGDQMAIQNSTPLPQWGKNNALTLLLVFFMGVLTSMTPCVYPLIPITLTLLGGQKKQSQWVSFLKSLTYVLGLSTTYATLGVIAAQTGQLFGSFMGHPLVLLATSCVFLAMGLSLWGFFELKIPNFASRTVGKTKSSHLSEGVGIFISGLISGLVASPCVGPVLVGILAYIAQTKDSFLGFTLLFTFALGFGTLLIALGTFSQWVHKIPKSGNWMNAVKKFLALTLFALSFYYAYPLIKKYGLANVKISPSQKEKTISWEKFSPEKVQQATDQGRPIIIDFYADWCATCVELDQWTFSDKTVGKESRKFLMLKVDATVTSKTITQWQREYQVYGLPTILFIDPSGKTRQELTLNTFEKPVLFLKRMKKALQVQTPP